MTAINRHRILRQVLELDVASMAGVSAIQEAVAGQFQNQALPELEALFDRLAGPDEILSLDRLEVDLGDLSGPDWQEQFHARLLEQMRQLLEQASRPGADSPPREPSPSTEAHTLFQQWLFYLAHGRLPWWGGEPEPGWPDTFCERLDPEQWEALTRLLRGDGKARLRLIHTVSDGVLARLAETLSGLPEAARVLAVLAPVGLSAESARHWRQQFWMTLLARAPEVPPRIETGALLLRRLLEQRDAITRSNASPYRDGPAAWRPEAGHAGEASLPPNAVDLSSAKPSPAGQIRRERIWSRGERPQGSGQDSPETLDWVRGNQNKEKSLFKSPHPILLPEGEGVHVLKSTALSLPPLPDPWRRWFESAAARPEELPVRSPDNAPQSETSTRARPDVPFQRLLFYLAHGRLPAGGGEPEPGWPETLGERPDGRAWKTLGDLLRSDAMARLRLVHAVGDGFLARLAETLAGLPQADRVSAMLAPAGLSAESARYWRQQFWIALLAWVPEQPLPIAAGTRLLLRLLELRDAVAMPGNRIGLPARWPGDESRPLGTDEGEGLDSTALPLPEPWRHWLEVAASQNADVVWRETGGAFYGDATTPASAEFPEPSTDATEQGPPTDAPPPIDADIPFQRLLFFLAQGRLPAWGGEPEAGWTDALGQQLHAGQWQMLAERLRGDYRARLRLVHSVSNGFLATLVETVAGLPEATRVSGLLSPADLSRESRWRWRQQLWMVLLEWIAEEGSAQPRSGERLLQRLLEQRAAVAAADPKFNRDASYSPAPTRHHNIVDIRNPLEQARASAKTPVATTNLPQSLEALTHTPRPPPTQEPATEDRSLFPSPSGRRSPEGPDEEKGAHGSGATFEGQRAVRFLPEKEWLDSTAPPLPEPWRQWFEVAAQRIQAEESGEDPTAPANFPPIGEVTFRSPPLQEGEAVYLTGAGAVILHPFMEELFRSRELLEGRAFRDEAARRRAVSLLGYLAFGTENTPEYDLLLPKLLCGMAWEEPLPPAELTEEERQSCEELLRAVLKHWSMLKSGSPEWLREQFLLREGKLERLEENWKLTVERRIQDVLLDRLPWGIGLIRLPWMDGFLHVSWVE